MATEQHGLAFLDLEGNRVVWNANDKTRKEIRLVGSHFHDIVLMATLSISILCLVFFIAILTGLSCVCCGRRHEREYLPFALVWVPVFGMIGFFGIDIVNRVYHETEPMVSSLYLAIDIARGALSSTADTTLRVYLTKEPRVDVSGAKLVLRLPMIATIGIFSMISAAQKGSQIWHLVASTYLKSESKPSRRAVVVVSSEGGESGDGGYADTAHESKELFTLLGTVAIAVLFYFAIVLTICSIAFVRRLSRRHTAYRRLIGSVGILATTFVGRSAVQFVFGVVYSQFGYTASLLAQLGYMILYGSLSVELYASILLIAAVHSQCEPLARESRYGQVQQAAVFDGVGWQHEKEKDRRYINTDAHPSSYENYAYHYDEEGTRRWGEWSISANIR